MTKSVETVVEDIYKLFDGHECDNDRVRRFGDDLGRIVADRLASYGVHRNATLRMSNLGKPDRQLWYEIKSDVAKEELAPHTKFKFLYGDILEAVVLFLAVEAGHTVEMQQAEVDVKGIKGHIDAVIDGTLVDVKSASTHAFKKFKDGKLNEDDPFGYYDQLAGYRSGTGVERAGWIAVDKQNGHLTYLEADKDELDSVQIEERAEHMKAVLASDDIPDRCYEPEEEGKSGNLKLGLNCSYCSFKQHCWADANDGIGLRTFLYAKGPVHLVKVEKEPNVPEITF